MIPLFQYCSILLFYHFVDNFAGNVIFFGKKFSTLFLPPAYRRPRTVLVRGRQTLVGESIGRRGANDDWQ
jgi:hypothetical protein